MRWSPLVVVSTVLAAASIFEVAFAAPIASTTPEGLSARSNPNPVKVPKPPTPVKVTLGPKGRNVVLEKKFGAPTVVHDGITVAKENELRDHSPRPPGAAMIVEVAKKVNKRK